MPFTPTHIIAVVPFGGFLRTVPFSALAIGAVVPDMPMFVGLFSYAEAHSIPGLVTACLPLGLMMFFAFELIFRRPLQALLPNGVQARMRPPLTESPDASVTWLLLVCACLLFAAATHVFWDSFTHAGRWGTQVLPVLNTSVGIRGLDVPLYKVFQHGSSVIGLPLLLAVWIRSLSRTTPDENRVVSISLVLRYAMWCLFIGVPLALAVTALRSIGPVEHRAFVAATRTISILLGAFVIYAVVFQTAAMIGFTKQQPLEDVPGD